MDREQQIELEVLSRKMTQKLMQTEEFQAYLFITSFFLFLGDFYQTKKGLTLGIMGRISEKKSNVWKKWRSDETAQWQRTDKSDESAERYFGP